MRVCVCVHMCVRVCSFSHACTHLICAYNRGIEFLSLSLSPYHVTLTPHFTPSPFFPLLSLPPSLPPFPPPSLLPPSHHPHSAQENASLKTELASRSKALQEAQEHSTRLLSDLHRAKNAAKGAGGEGHAEKVTELEERLRQVEDDNLSLQVWVCV